MEEWVNCDEDLPNSSELTNTKIIQLSQDEARDDTVMRIRMMSPFKSSQQLRKAAHCLWDFCLCTQIDSSCLDNIALIERQLNNAMAAQTRQNY